MDPAEWQIITISKPFARSLPANPVFGLMSHAPHLPRREAAWGPFSNTGRGSPACSVGPVDCRGLGVPEEQLEISAERKLEDRMVNETRFLIIILP